MSTTKVSTRTETVNANTTLEEFPAGLPRPDHARNWGRSAESVLAQRGLTDVSQGKITPGTFEPLWPDELLEDPPALPPNASFSDRARYTSWLRDVEKMRAHNLVVCERREAWWRDKNNELFTILTDSMVRTQPSLRELLRQHYHVKDGFYDGCAALRYIETWLQQLQKNAPQHEFFDKAHDTFRDKRLPVGSLHFLQAF